MPTADFAGEFREHKNPAHALADCDDHPLIRVGIRHLLEEQINWTVVAEAGDAREAVSKAREKPDIAILDIGMPS